MSRRVIGAIASFLLIATIGAPGTLATSVTPFKNAKWHQDQVVPFAWKSDARPPAWMRPNVLDAADDASTTTLSNAATFTLTDSSSSWIGYMDDVCTDTALACAQSYAPNSFTVKIRPHGWSFDWGTLRWCQFYDTPPDGCFDIEMVVLHELGHVQGLGHIDDAPDPGDWIDSVMHAVSHAKPKVGWNAHSYGRCDAAALQAVYTPATASTRISTCLALSTVSSLSAPSSIAYRATVRFTASLATAADVSYAPLRSLPLSGRVMTLQRRLPGGSSWTTIGQMTSTTSDGQYTLSQSLTTTYDWRVVFSTPSNEGLIGDVSDVVRVNVGDCTSACPVSAPRVLNGGMQ